MIEWIGYFGSLIIVISLMMNSIVKLRWLNMFGATIFAIYGIIIGAIPVALLNATVAFINIYYLVKIYNQKDFLKILHIRTENKYLEYLVDYYREDINTYFPGFYESFKEKLFKNEKDLLCFLILRNAAVAGIFIGKKINGDEMLVEIDFALPEYRDLKTGYYIYKQNQIFFEKLGIKKLISIPRSHKHYAYLKKMDFNEEADPANKVVLTRNIS